MKKEIVSIIGAILIMSGMGGCQKHVQEKSPNELVTRIDNRLSNIIAGNFDKETARTNIQILVDMLRHDIIPAVSDADKKEAAELADFLYDIKDDAPKHMSDEPGLIEASRVFMRLHEMLVRIDPAEFDIHLRLSANYISLATSIGGYDGASKEAVQLNKEFNERGVSAAEALVKNFPDKPLAYGQLAHSLVYGQGRRQKAIDTLHRCLEMDKDFEYCKDLLKAFSDDW